MRVDVWHSLFFLMKFLRLVRIPARRNTTTSPSSWRLISVHGRRTGEHLGGNNARKSVLIFLSTGCCVQYLYCSWLALCVEVNLISHCREFLLCWLFYTIYQINLSLSFRYRKLAEKSKLPRKFDLTNVNNVKMSTARNSNICFGIIYPTFTFLSYFL